MSRCSNAPELLVNFGREGGVGRLKDILFLSKDTHKVTDPCAKNKPRLLLAPLLTSRVHTFIRGCKNLATNGLTSGCPGTHRKPSKSNPTKM
jgi:hypothetical protein